MRAAGYRTGMFGHYIPHAGTIGMNKPAAWDEWYALVSGGNYEYTLNVNGQWLEYGPRGRDHFTDRLAAEAMRFMAVNRDNPFFLVYAPLAPDDPGRPPARHANLFPEYEPPRPPNFREPDVSRKPHWVRFAKADAAPVAGSDAQQLEQWRSLQAVDEAVQEISETVDRLGLTDNTMVLFMSDNGLQRGEHWWGSKFTSYEEAIRVPMIMRYPQRFPLPRVEGSIVLNIDVAPTIAEAAGADATAVDGESLFGSARGTGCSTRSLLDRELHALLRQAE